MLKIKDKREMKEKKERQRKDDKEVDRELSLKGDRRVESRGETCLAGKRGDRETPGRYQRLYLFIQILRVLCPNLTDSSYKRLEL